MSGSPFDEILREAARQCYNVPPATPREAMWARIEAARRQERERPPPPRFPVRLRWGVGLAAMLAVGIGVGRLSVDRSPARGVAEAPASDSLLGPPPIASRDPTPAEVLERRVEEVGPARELVRPGPRDGARAGGARQRSATPVPTPAPLYRFAAVEALGQAEALLISFRADARQGQVDPQVVEWAREVLSTTRLLLDSPAAKDSQIQRLLEDLELVLVQIVQLAGRTAGEEELQWIGEALEQREMLPRLRAAVPSGSPARAT